MQPPIKENFEEVVEEVQSAPIPVNQDLNDDSYDGVFGRVVEEGTEVLAFYKSFRDPSLFGNAGSTKRPRLIESTIRIRMILSKTRGSTLSTYLRIKNCPVFGSTG